MAHSWQIEQVDYKKWKPAQISALEKHTYAVVAGTHIKPLNPSPALRSIHCLGEDNAGKIKVASLNGQDLVCMLTGADLSSVKELKASTAGGPSLSAKVTTNGDVTFATATFSAADVSKFLLATYQLHLVDSSGSETDVKPSLTIAP